MDAMDICMDSELLSCTNETTEVIQNILNGIIAKNPGLVNCHEDPPPKCHIGKWREEKKEAVRNE